MATKAEVMACYDCLAAEVADTCDKDDYWNARENTCENPCAESDAANSFIDEFHANYDSYLSDLECE